MTTTEGRILGIDYGTRRIGLAISDPLRILATSYGALSNSTDVIERIKDVIAKEQITLIVVGLPLSLSGKKTSKAIEVESFVGTVQSHCHVDVAVWDERFTTSMARQSLLTMGAKKKDRRGKDGKIDSMAAAIMLQGFLDSTKHSMSC